MMVTTMTMAMKFVVSRVKAVVRMKQVDVRVDIAP